MLLLQISHVHWQLSKFSKLCFQQVSILFETGRLTTQIYSATLPRACSSCSFVPGLKAPPEPSEEPSDVADVADVALTSSAKIEARLAKVCKEPWKIQIKTLFLWKNSNHQGVCWNNISDISMIHDRVIFISFSMLIWACSYAGCGEAGRRQA